MTMIYKEFVDSIQTAKITQKKGRVLDWYEPEYI